MSQYDNIPFTAPVTPCSSHLLLQSLNSVYESLRLTAGVWATMISAKGRHQYALSLCHTQFFTRTLLQLIGRIIVSDQPEKLREGGRDCGML